MGVIGVATRPVHADVDEQIWFADAPGFVGETQNVGDRSKLAITGAKGKITFVGLKTTDDKTANTPVNTPIPVSGSGC